MTFTTITTAEIATSEPVKNSTLTKIKDDLDDLNTRVTNLDLSVAQPPIVFRVNGSYVNYVTTGILKTTINFNLTVTGVYLVIDTAGASGTTQIDLKYKRGAGAYTSILTTLPSVAYSAGNDSTSTNAVLNSGQTALQAGDILRMDITSAQSATARNFMVRIDFLKT